MALSDKNLTLEMMERPLNLQRVVLEDIQSRLGGDNVIVDPNFVAMHLIEMTSNLTSNFALAAERAVSQQMAARANSAEELYKHMSDYDYINVFATPSMASLVMIIDKDYIINNGELYNNSYYQVIIPKDTVFTLGNIEFGIYYPISIRINKNTLSPLVLYDLSEDNPLKTMGSNIVNYSTYSYMSMNVISIEFPIYQFVKTTKVEAITPSNGFVKKYTFNDKFYAVRVFSTKNNVTTELHHTFSNSVYDSYTPTAKITVEPDSNELSVNIPQIYFTNEQVGSLITVEIYTTKGDIANNVSTLTSSQISVNYNLNKNSSKYSTILGRIPTPIFNVTSVRLSGGTNGLTFEEMRERVINNSFHNSVLVTPTDLQNYFKDHGFKIKKYEDNLTNLTYFAYKTLKDNTECIVPSSDIYIRLTPEMVRDIDDNKINSNNSSTVCSTIKGQLKEINEVNPDTSDTEVISKYEISDTVTILPTTIYKYDNNNNCCTPLTNRELEVIKNYSKEEKIDYFNSNSFVYYPFHIRLVPDTKYTKASSYNLVSPTIKNFIFESENDTLTAQAVSTDGAIYHVNGKLPNLTDDSSDTLKNVDEYYAVRLVVIKSSDLKEIPEEDFKLYIYTRDPNGTYLATEAEKIEEYENYDIYQFFIATDSNINRDHQISAVNFANDNGAFPSYIDFDQKYNLVFMVRSEYYPDASTPYSYYDGVFNRYRDEWTVLIRQTCDISLGHALDDVIYNNIDIDFTSEEYLKYETDEVARYTTDIFEIDESTGIYQIVKDEKGNLKVDDYGNVGLNLLHKQGDIIYDLKGNKVYLHRVGDYKLDKNGEKIKSHSRGFVYRINAPMLDYRIKLSEHPSDISYIDNLPNELENYFDVLREADNHLLERDNIYFKPMKTLGSSIFSIGDSVTTTLPLNMSIDLKVHLERTAYIDAELRSLIEDAIINLVEEELSNTKISLVDIGNRIKNEILYISSVDVLGICGNRNLQTITLLDESVRPSLGKELYLTKDNTIGMRKKVNIEFVLA